MKTSGPGLPWAGVRASMFYRAAAFGILAASLLGCGSSSISNNQLQSELQKNLTDYLAARSSAEHISALSLTVNLRGQSQDINVAVGTTKYGGGVAVTPSNVFQIGSNTKAFTSVAILQLEAAGVLSIDDTIGKWLPQYPAWSNVTIRQLLHMTSGIPNYSNTSSFQTEYSANPMIEYTPAQLIAFVYPTLNTPPGKAWDYSNTNYILLQMIVDEASPSKSYEAENRRIVAAAGLTNTYYAPYFYPQSVMQRLVSGYFDNADAPDFSGLMGKDVSGFSVGWSQGAGGMIATPEDLTKWIRDLFEGNVLPPKQLQEFESLVSMNSGQPIAEVSTSEPAFGLGVYKSVEAPFGIVWSYQGAMLGYRATYIYSPDNGMIICVFTNSQTSDAQNKIAKTLFPVIYTTLKNAGRVQ